MRTTSARVLVVALALSRSGATAETAPEPPAQPVAPPPATPDGSGLQPVAPAMPQAAPRSGESSPAMPPPTPQPGVSFGTSTPPPGSAPPEDRGVKPLTENQPSEESKLPWHDTWLILENLVTAQTVGVGRSYQSYNPTYDASLSLRPRYYFYDSEKESFYASGRIDLSREFTNSDTTTERGELVIGGARHGLESSDPTLFPGYRRLLARRGDYDTTFVAYAPIFTFPLSKFSMDNGMYLGLGSEVRFYQDVPLAGAGSSTFKKLTLGFAAAYNHTFSRAPVGTNLQLFRLRMDPEGKTVPGDQLTGAAFPKHEVRTTFRIVVEITKDFTWWTDVGYEPTWLYEIEHGNVVIQNGTYPTSGIPNPTTFVTTTHFETSFYYHLLNELTVGLGYANTSVQPGLDGQRRNIFYSPSAFFVLELICHLDEIYLTAAGRRSAETSVTYH